MSDDVADPQPGSADGGAASAADSTPAPGLGSSANLIAGTPQGSMMDLSKKPTTPAPGTETINPETAGKADARLRANEKAQAALTKINADVAVKLQFNQRLLYAWLVLGVITIAICAVAFMPALWFFQLHAVFFLLVGAAFLWLLHWKASKKMDWLFIFLMVDIVVIVTELFFFLFGLALTVGDACLFCLDPMQGTNGPMKYEIGVTSVAFLGITTAYHIFAWTRLFSLYQLMRKAQNMSFRLRGKTLQRRRSSRASLFMSPV